MCKFLVLSSVLYVTSIVLTCIHSYVLLAANLDDFKKVAKRIVPEKLAMQIAEMATSSSIRKVPEVYKASNPEENEDEETERLIENQEDIEDKKRDLTEEAEVLKKVNNKYNTENFNKMRSINFEELVQQVKKRIEDDIMKKQMQIAMSQREKHKTVDTSNSIKHFNLQKQHKEKSNHKVSRQYDNHANYKKDHEQQQKEKYNNVQEHITPLQYANNMNYANDHKNTNIKKKDVKKHEPVEESNDGYQIEHYQDKKQDVNVKGATYENEKQHNRHQNYKDKEHHSYESYEYETQTEANKYKETNHKLKRPLEVEEEESSFFTKITMVTNDSYEDYVTPIKENVYASKESTETKNKERGQKLIVIKETIEPVAKVSKEYEYERDKSYYNNNDDGLKAKTENLWYDDYDTNKSVEFDKHEKVTPEIKAVTLNIKPIKVKGTMIPKRDFYKISSPNYYAKIPVVAEKYDFNEPIPEHVREPEDKRSLPLPPSFINGKIRINH